MRTNPLQGIPEKHGMGTNPLQGIPEEHGMGNHPRECLDKKSIFWNFSEWGLPGGQIVRTTRVSILPPTICPPGPYRANTFRFLDFRIFYYLALLNTSMPLWCKLL